MSRTKPWENKQPEAPTPEAPAPEAPAPEAPTPEAPAPEAPAPEAPAPEAPAPEASKTVVPEGEPYVTVTVPKSFKLRLDDHVVVDYKAGIQDIPVAHADHWWSKANGVVEYKARKPE